jgi:hypothetical protein
LILTPVFYVLLRIVEKAVTGGGEMRRLGPPLAVPIVSESTVL